jgi:hypothetical protein
MGGLPEPPHGWDPKTDSLEDLVYAMFQDDSTESPRSTASAAAPTPASDPRERPSPAARKRRTGATRLLTGRTAAPLLAAAALVTAALAGGQILTATPAAAPVAVPAPVPGPPTAATPTPQPVLTAAAAAGPVALDFGKRSAMPDGWSLASSRPYLCDVLMAIPVLQKDGTRIMRVTLTLTNRTGAPQATRQWRLAATADGAPAEFVLWPAERFRGVPDMTLNAGRSVRFLVAFRVPEHPVQVRINAAREAAPGAVLAGTL